MVVKKKLNSKRSRLKSCLIIWSETILRIMMVLKLMILGVNLFFYCFIFFFSFSDVSRYHVLKGVLLAISNVGDIFKEDCAPVVARTLLRLLEKNDNETNKYSGYVYVALLIELLGKLQLKDEGLRIRRRKMLNNHLELEISEKIPSHNGIILRRFFFFPVHIFLL
jgi:hypothetical protein